MRASSTTPLVLTAPNEVVVFAEYGGARGADGGAVVRDVASLERVDDVAQAQRRCQFRTLAKAYAKKYQLVICFAIAITAGLAFPTPGMHAGTKYRGVSPFAIVCVMLIFFLNGLKLRPR